MAIDVGALAVRYPQYRIIDAIQRPDGGIWALGADGGVITMDASGNLDSGPLYGAGSLPGLGAALGDPAVHGQAIRIQSDQATGGYTIVNSRGETYGFQGPGRPQEPIAPAAPGPPPPNTEAELNQLMAALRPLGLETLVNDAWGYYKGPAGGSVAAVMDWLPTTDAYKTRFPAMEYLRGIGQAWTPAQYISYETAIREGANRFGIPADFIDREDIGAMIRGDKSVNEALDDMRLASEAVFSSPETLAWMQQNLGIDSGSLMAYYLDTDGKGPSFVERQRRLTQAQIGGAAAQAGFGGISAAEAARLESQGLSPEQARTAFAQVAGLHPLFSETLGEEVTGQDLGRTEQLGLVSGQAQAEEAVQRRQRARQAQFAGGGGAQTGGRGRTGLGSTD